MDLAITDRSRDQYILFDFWTLFTKISSILIYRPHRTGWYGGISYNVRALNFRNEWYLWLICDIKHHWILSVYNHIGSGVTSKKICMRRDNVLNIYRDTIFHSQPNEDKMEGREFHVESVRLHSTSRSVDRNHMPHLGLVWLKSDQPVLFFNLSMPIGSFTIYNSLQCK